MSFCFLLFIFCLPGPLSLASGVGAGDCGGLLLTAQGNRRNGREFSPPSLAPLLLVLQASHD